MRIFTELLGCKHPIACMAMNRVSDVKLAVACSQAGILPSLSIFNYYVRPGELGLDKFRTAVAEFNTQTGFSPLLVSVSVDTIIDDASFQLLIDCQIKVLEILFDSPSEIEITTERLAKRDLRISKLRENGIFVLSKALDVMDIEASLIDGIILKGPDAAGRIISDGTSLISRIKKCKELYPQLHIIASGGIGTSTQVQECIDAGAIGVGIGTMFAAAEESSISIETKLKMVAANADDIGKLKNGAQQQALIFKELHNDVNNNTRGLAAGIKNPESGHVFAGKGISQIEKIVPVKEIVNMLTKDLTA